MRGRKPDLRTIPGGKSDDTRTKAPSWLSKEAKAEWRRVVPVLVKRRILTDADLGCLEAYCTAIGQIRQCQAVLSNPATATFVQSEQSAPRAHPAYRLMHGAMTQARQLAAELGLTPVSRSRPSIAEGEDNAWSGLVDG